MKSLFGTLICFLLLFVISACSEMNTECKYEISQTIDGVTVTRFSKSSPKEMLEYASTHPNVRITSLNN